jgi:hypothetical protein
MSPTTVRPVHLACISPGEPVRMRWIGLVFGRVAGSILAANASDVVEVDRVRIRALG